MADLPRTTATQFGLVWQDTMGVAAAFPTGSTAPALANLTSANIQAYQYAVNDLLHFQLQLPHGAAAGSDLRCHVHFLFPTQPTAGQYIKWEAYYTIGAINAAFGAESSIQTVEYQVQASDAMYHRVSALFTATVPAVPQSSILCGRLRRIAATSGSESSVSPVILFVDAHFQEAGPGTVGEFS